MPTDQLGEDRIHPDLAGVVVDSPAYREAVSRLRATEAALDDARARIVAAEAERDFDAPEGGPAEFARQQAEARLALCEGNPALAVTGVEVFSIDAGAGWEWADWVQHRDECLARASAGLQEPLRAALASPPGGQYVEGRDERDWAAGEAS